MPAAPLCEATLNEGGHVLPCLCERCMPLGADGAEDDARDLHEARAKSLPKWMERGPAQHAWNRKLVA